MGVGATSLAVLLQRAWAHVRRQRLSYVDLPFGGWPLAPTSDAFAERARGALVGAALGDALGFFRESLPPWLCRLRFGEAPKHRPGRLRFMRKPGTISDDTQLSLIVARSIANDGSVSVERFERELSDWIPRAIGAGRATLHAARALARNSPSPDPKSLGNGAAIRVAPLAVALGQSQKMLDAVRRISSSTHTHPEAIAAAELVALLYTRALLRLELDVDALDRALHETSTKDPSTWRAVLSRAHGAALSAGDLGPTSGLVFDTVGAAVFLFVRYPKDPLRGLAELFTRGGDVDSIGSIYCGWVGARETLSAFDNTLIAPLQGLGVIVKEADRLATIRKKIRS